MKIQLSDHFGFLRLIRFTLPSVFMMIFTSIYGVIDGFFVSNFVGKIPFAAINFIMPFLMVVGALGFMFGTGGSAYIAKLMGQGKNEKAQKIFSMLIYMTIISGMVITVLSIIFIKPIAVFLGAEGVMLSDCVRYGVINLLVLPFLMLQYAFGSFVITSGKPKIGLVITIVAGVTNIVFDALFIVVFKWGIVGAALATAMSQIVGGIIPLIYFSVKNTSLLRICKPEWNGIALLKICINGSSELINNISMSLVGMLYNMQLLKYSGENGVAAYGTIMYVSFIFLSAFIGYSTGVAPIISYNYGAGNIQELKGLYKKSLIITILSSAIMFLTSIVFAKTLSGIFVGYDKTLFEMTSKALIIYSYSFLFSGIVIFGSAFFTALNNGVISAIISFVRTLVFQVVAVIVMPLVWELDGIWYSVPVAELLAIGLTIFFIVYKRKEYKYY